MKIVKPETKVLDHHITWFEQEIYTKSILGDYKICGEKTKIWFEEKQQMRVTRDMLCGTILHKVLEIFNQGFLDTEAQKLYLVDVPDLIEHYWHKWVTTLRPRESSLLDDLTKSNLVQAFSKYVPMVSEWCLYPRETEIQFGGDGETKIGEVSVGGHIDLIDKYPSVVDYKWVGRNSRYLKQKEPGLDALIYLAGASALGYHPKKFRYILFVHNGTEVDLIKKEFEINEDNLVELEWQVAELANGIKQKFWHEPEWGVGRGLCSPKWCPYWGRCKFTEGREK